MSELNIKTVALKRDKIPQIHRSLLRLGFKREGDDTVLMMWKWASSNPQANLQQIVFAREEIDPNGQWIFLTGCARQPFACDGAAVIERYARQRQSELERELRLAKEYWRQTVQPYIESPMPDLVQWYVADEAYYRLRDAIGKSSHWNAPREGQQFPVPAEVFADLTTDEFRRPELLSQDENLKRALEGQSPPAGMSPAESIRWTRQRQLDYNALPEKPDMRGNIRLALCEQVTFDQIKSSNEKPGQLPLLPPVPADGAASLSKETIKKLVADFLRKHPEASNAIQREVQNHDRILLRNLLCLRRERFDEHGHAPELIASRRKPPEAAQKTKPAPPEVNETVLWHVQQRIQDGLDTKLKSAPSASQVFIHYCRDRMKLVEMRKKFGWNNRTLKARKAALQIFLQTNFNGLTLDAFFVDRRIFTAAERQLKDDRAKRISRRSLAECGTDEDDT